MILLLLPLALAEPLAPAPEPPPAPAEPVPVDEPEPVPEPVPVPELVPVPEPVPVPVPEPVPDPHPEPVLVPVPVPAPAPAPEPLLDTGLLPAPWRPVPVPIGPTGPTFGDLLPEIRSREPRSALGLFLLALVTGLGAGAARSLRRGLRDSGLLPSLLVALETAGRLLSFGLGIGAIVALVPPWLVPALPWIAVAGALALGWSLRDALPDFVAWLFLAAEGRVRPGHWLRGDGFDGRVEALTLRSTWVVDNRGRRTCVPNRTLLQRPVVSGADRWPEVQVIVSLPDVGPAVARAALREATLLSPWIAPAGVPEIGQDTRDPTRWTVRVRLLDGRYQDRFEGAFPERIRDVLEAHRG